MGSDHFFVTFVVHFVSALTSFCGIFVALKEEGIGEVSGIALLVLGQIILYTHVRRSR